MMICPHCQSENREGAKFCNECGSPLLSSADKTQVIDAVALDDMHDLDGREEADDADKTQVIDAVALGDAQELDGREETNDADKTQVIDADTPLNAEDPKVSGVDETNPSKLIDEDDSDFIDDAAELQDIEEAEDEELGQTPDEQAASHDAIDDAEREALDEALPRIDIAQSGGSDSLASEQTRKIDLNAANTVDLSGFERLVDSSYVPPARSWRSGDTMELSKIEGEPAPAQKKYESPDTEKEAKKRKAARRTRTIVAVAVVAILAAAAIGITYSLELWGGKTVPDVTGEAQADAIWLLESKGFAVDTSQVKSDEVEGIVLITDPAAGSRVPSGTTVNVSIATPRAVPDIVGSTQDEAKAAFEKEGLGNVTFKTVKSDETEGTVLEVEPQAGTKVKSATAVTVTVAESYVVPDVAGKSQDDATAALKEAGYAVEVATKYSEDGSEGTVLSTDPAAETKLKSGSTVTITVSKSREKELVSETNSFFSKGATIVIDGINYEVVSCDSVNYEGDGVVSYTITAKKFENTLLFGTIYGSAEQKSGTIKWNSDNSIASSKPSLKK